MGVITKLNGCDTWQLAKNNSNISVNVVDNMCYNITIASSKPTKTERCFISVSVVAIVQRFLDAA
ncbi:MAG: hypothetical protein ACM31H_06430 [Nitrososphaerales archaeon]